MTRPLILSSIWAYAALVWGSIAHSLVGLPDIGPVVAPALFAGIVILPHARNKRGHALTDSRIWSRVRWWLQATSTTES
jgi:hypothetical protein